MRKQYNTAIGVLILLGLFSACGGESNVGMTENQTSAVPETVQTEAVTEETYQMPALDLGGGTFTILNSITNWGFYTTFDLEEQTGDTLDDAVFNRNRKVEEMFNVKLLGVDEDIGSAANELRKTVNAGEDVYQSALIALSNISPLIQEQMLMDMRACDTVQFDREWWDQEILTVYNLGGKDVVWFAASELSLTGLECTVVPFFNERILNNLDLESPYDLVRDGTWTFDKLGEYAKAGANLNGADSFDKYDANGPAQYGIVSYSTFPHAMVIAAGEDYIRLDNTGMPYLAIENERFFNVAEKIASLTATSGEFNNFNNGDIHYELIFRDGRALMTIAQVKATTKFRSMEDEFGILPMPKYDESQENYRCMRTGTSCVVCLPVTVSDMEASGAVVDALSYYSYTDILPAYYDVTLTQKGLRNEDSIEMMNIIRDSRVPEIGSTFGWTSSISTQIETQLMNGKSDLASKIASAKTKVESLVAKTMEILNEQE